MPLCCALAGLAVARRLRHRVWAVRRGKSMLVGDVVTVIAVDGCVWWFLMIFPA